MIFYSTYDVLDEVFYKDTMPGTIMDVTFSLDENTGYMVETYGVELEDGTFVMYVPINDLSYLTPGMAKMCLS